MSARNVGSKPYFTCKAITYKTFFYLSGDHYDRTFGGSGFMEKRWNDMNSNLNAIPSAGALTPMFSYSFVNSVMVEMRITAFVAFWRHSLSESSECFISR